MNRWMNHIYIYIYSAEKLSVTENHNLYTYSRPASKLANRSVWVIQFQVDFQSNPIPTTTLQRTRASSLRTLRRDLPFEALRSRKVETQSLVKRIIICTCTLWYYILLVVVQNRERESSWPGSFLAGLPLMYQVRTVRNVLIHVWILLGFNTALVAVNCAVCKTCVLLGTYTLFARSVWRWKIIRISRNRYIRRRSRFFNFCTFFSWRHLSPSPPPRSALIIIAPCTTMLKLYT